MFYFTLNCAQRKRARSATWHGQINDETGKWMQAGGNVTVVYGAYAPLESTYWVVDKLWQLWVSHQARLDPSSPMLCVRIHTNSDFSFHGALPDFSLFPAYVILLPVVPVTQLSCRTLMKRRCVPHSYKQIAKRLHTPRRQLR